MWFENGQKVSEGNMVNGKRSGFWTFWLENGEIYSQGII